MLGAVVVGLALAAAALSSWRVSEGPGALGAQLQMTARPTGELEVAPLGPFLSATNLRPDATGATGRLGVRNQTGAALAVQLRLVPTNADLDQALSVEVSAGGDRVAKAPLGQLRDWSSHSFRLAPGQTGDVLVRAWLPNSADRAYQGTLGEVAVDFRVDRVD